MARRRWIAPVAAATGFVAPAAAHAGTYDVVACNAPGAAGANDSWTGTATSYDSACACPPPAPTTPHGACWAAPASARIRRQAGHPYELGCSRSVVVRVR